MMNLKKLFASVASVMILASTLPTTVLGAASYSGELQGAYDYAYGIGITTKSSIDQANMLGTLKRVDMAKMMANYAVEVLGKTPDTSKACAFNDVSKETSEMNSYMVKACQLGLMGVDANGAANASFNPQGIVTRAQFGTVLSRALYGTANEGGTPYYAGHLSALKDAGIMTNISNPNQLEIRGYVMLMMQRADTNGGANTDICKTEENIVNCSLGLSSCPAQCTSTDNEVKAGTLSVSSKDVGYSSIPAVGAVKHSTITFKAGSEDVKLYSVEMKKTSLATINSSARIYFEKNGVRISGKATFSEDKATLSFNTALTVKAGSSEIVDLYVYLNDVTTTTSPVFNSSGIKISDTTTTTPLLGNEYQFTSTKIDSSASDVNGSITTSLLKTMNYSVMGLTVTNPGIPYSYKVDSTKLVELGTFRLGSFSNQGTKNLLLNSVTVNQYENASTSNLDEVALYRDDVKVSTKTTVNGRDITFLVDDTVKYTQSNATYVIKGKITNAERVGDKYQFQLKYPENMDIVEDTTDFRATITNGTTALMMSTMTINGGDVKFNQPSTSSTKQVVPGAQHVVFYTGTITSLAAVTLENLNLNIVANTGVNVLTRTLYARIGNTVLSADAPSTLTGLITFNGTVTVNGTVPFTVYADIKDTAPAASIYFADTVNLTRFDRAEYVENNQPATSSLGSLSAIKNNIVAATLSFDNTVTSTKTVQKGDKAVILAKLEFSTTTDVMSKVYSFKANLSGTNNGNFAGGVVTVYDANGNALVSDSITSGSAMTFVLPTALSVSKNNPLVLTVKLDQVANAVTASDFLQLQFNTVIAKDVITTNNIDLSTKLSALLDVVSAGTVSVVAQSFTPKLVKLDGTVATIGTLKFKPFNGDAKLKTLTIGATALTAFEKVELKDGTDTVAIFVKSGANQLFAENIDKTIAIDATKTYDVVATLKSATTSNDLAADTTLTIVQADFESMNGTVIHAATLGTAVSSVMTFVKAKPTVAYVGMTQGGTKAYYKFTVKADGGDINVSALNFGLTNNTDTLSGGVVNLWLDNEGGTLLATGLQDAAPGVADTFTFSSLATTVTVNNGETKTFVLVMPITTWMKSTANGNVNVDLTNMSYVDSFSDDTTSTHSNVFTNFLWDIAPAGMSISLK